jgi:hypothetical protein
MAVFDALVFDAIVFDVGAGVSAVVVTPVLADYVVLAEIQPMEPLRIWNAAGGGFTNTYYAPYASQIATTIVPGGIYRRLDSVKLNGIALTALGSIAAVDASAGSYFFDTTTSRIYVHTISGTTPEAFAIVGAWFSLFFSTSSVSFADQPLYAPIITGDLPVVRSEKPDFLFGSNVAVDGSVTLLNGDALFDRLSRAYVWRNKTATFRMGGTGSLYADFVTVCTLRINSIGVSDDVATIVLEDTGTVINRSIPGQNWGDDPVYRGLVADSELSKPRAILFGPVDGCPLTLQSLSDYNYLVVSDINPSFATVRGVSAVDRVSGNTRQLAEGSEYSVGLTVDFVTGFTSQHVTILDLGVTSAVYEVRADLTDNGNTGTVGAFARRVLDICGASLADIDTAAFAAADAAAVDHVTSLAFDVGLYLFTPTPAIDIVRRLEQSCLGQVFQLADGRWSMSIFDPSLPADYSLSDADFSRWEPLDDLSSVLNEVRVQYHHHPVTGALKEASSSDDAVLYGSETSDSHRVPTYLRNDGPPTRLAQRLRWFKSAPAGLIEFEERGLSLMGATAGAMIAVTRDRGPNARTGRLDGQLFELVHIEKSLGPDAPVIRGVLSDLGGRADHIARLAPAASTLTWSTATATEKAQYGFLGDSNRYIDAADVLTKDGKAMY